MKTRIKIHQRVLFCFLFLILNRSAMGAGKTWGKYKNPDPAGWSYEKPKEIHDDHKREGRQGNRALYRWLKKPIKT